MSAARVLRIIDETPTGQALHEVTVELRLASERVTVRELIERRVRAEVERHNAAPTEYFKGLVQPTEAERELNGYRLREARRIDPEEQARLATESFARQGFLLLVDDDQIDDLADEVVLTPDTTVRFVKLVPLVGG
jgi:hypothetical protein